MTSLLLAAASASFAMASVLQHRALAAQQRAGGSGWVGVLRQSRWWRGVAVDVTGVGVETRALATGSLVAAGAIVACGLPLAAVSLRATQVAPAEDLRSSLSALTVVPAISALAVSRALAGLVVPGPARIALAAGGSAAMVAGVVVVFQRAGMPEREAPAGQAVAG